MRERRSYTEAEYTYSIKIGTGLGFIVGWGIGVALVLYLNSPALNQWPLVASIPIWNGIGWALFGMIAGSGGLFSDWRLPEKAERRVNRMLHVYSAGKPAS